MFINVYKMKKSRLVSQINLMTLGRCMIAMFVVLELISCEKPCCTSDLALPISLTDSILISIGSDFDDVVDSFDLKKSDYSDDYRGELRKTAGLYQIEVLERGGRVYSIHLRSSTKIPRYEYQNTFDIMKNSFGEPINCGTKVQKDRLIVDTCTWKVKEVSVLLSSWSFPIEGKKNDTLIAYSLYIDCLCNK